MPKIENWSITRRPVTQEDVIIAALTGSVATWAFALAGTVTGHPRLEDNQPITTSPVKAINVEEKWAETKSGTNYTLGEIDPKWVEWMKANNYTLEDFTKPILNLAVEEAKAAVKN